MMKNSNNRIDRKVLGGWLILIGLAIMTLMSLVVPGVFLVDVLKGYHYRFDLIDWAALGVYFTTPFLWGGLAFLVAKALAYNMKLSKKDEG